MIRELGIEFIRARRHIGISQSDLSKRAGLSINYVSLLERGKHANPGITNLNRIAKKLGTSLDVILTKSHQNLII